jgi:hypothetical protein
MSSPSSKNTKSNPIKQTTMTSNNNQRAYPNPELNKLDQVCYNYLKNEYDVIKYDENQDQDWWVDTFLHKAVACDNGYSEEGWANQFLQPDSNNYEMDTSFMDTYVTIIRKITINEIVNRNNIFDILRYVNTYYKENYGEEHILKRSDVRNGMNWNRNKLVRHYCYVYGHLNIDKLKQKLKNN